MEDNKPFLAYMLLAVSFIALIGWQIIVEKGNSGRLTTNLKGRAEVVQRAEDTQRNLESFVVDLLTLAETNEGARAIVEKYQIRRGGQQ